MKILIAPDKFKGSLDAWQVCDTIRSGLLTCDTSLVCVNLPLADGGEGTCSLLTKFTQGEMINARARNPLFRMLDSGYGISKDGTTAFIEMAKASGLQLLNETERNPLYTSSVGTGDLIRHALDQGVATIILGIGGSATNDAGIGIGEALGLEFFSHSLEKLQPIGKNLIGIQSIQHGKLHPRCRDVRMIILCDVDNPLYGSNGAAFVYAPQKGADATSVKRLDEGLRHIANTLSEKFDVDINFPGAGAAGGVSVMIKALMHADVKSGMEFITAFTGLEQAIQDADVVITGEGKIDEQTLSGKVLQGVAKLAGKCSKPVIAVTGKCDLNSRQLNQLGITRVVTLVNESVTAQFAMENASKILEKRTIEAVFPLLATF